MPAWVLAILVWVAKWQPVFAVVSMWLTPKRMLTGFGFGCLLVGMIFDSIVFVVVGGICIFWSLRKDSDENE